MALSGVWVFCGNGGHLPSGVFSERATAEAWIKRHGLSGVLTRYPIDTGVYEWAIGAGVFEPRTPYHASASCIGRFTSAYLEHYHYDNGDP